MLQAVIDRLMVLFITVAAKALDLNDLQPEVSIKCQAFWCLMS
jgi:hypothetical protein